MQQLIEDCLRTITKADSYWAFESLIMRLGLVPCPGPHPTNNLEFLRLQPLDKKAIYGIIGIPKIRN